MKTQIKLFYVILLVSVLGTSTAQITQKGLNGNVKAVKEIRYEVNGEQAVKDTELSKVFDKNIKLIETGNLTPNAVIDKYSYKYDNKGRLIEQNLYQNGVLSAIGKYKYDKKGHKIEENWYKPNGKLYSRVIYKYDKSGNLIERKWYCNNGNLCMKWEYEYDENGNKIVEKRGRSEKTYPKASYKYDEQGTLIEKRFFDANGNLSEKVIYEYDQFGNPVSQKHYYPEKSEIKELKYQYKYDNKRNWMTKIKLGSDKPVYITERKIEYFE